jgi:RNA polymerase sigma-70 factor (ECF subfamily)
MKSPTDASSSAPSIPRGDPARDLPGTVQASWNRFVDLYDPLRPDLYRYCRYLTRSPWDAEDLAQDALATAFATLGRMLEAPPNPKAWLLRVASNLWIDQMRRRRPASEAETLAARGDDPRAPREAAGTLLARLSPQERAAVVLKDVFDMRLEEIAETLSTSPGAVKAALHRGRGKLVDPEAAERPLADRGVLDAFCDAFNARDLDRLTALLLETAEVEVVGATTIYGAKAARETVLPGMLFGSERMAAGDPLTGMEPRLMEGVLPSPPRMEVRVHRGEALLLSWYAHSDGEAVRAVTRADSTAGAITRLRNYFYTPDCLAEICRELGVPFRTNGHRHCHSSP